MFRKQKILREEITDFLGEVALLLENHLSLSEALALIKENQEKSVMVELIQDVHSSVQQGKSLANALAPYPQYFPPFLLELLNEAEQQEALPTMLTQIVRYRETTDLSELNLTQRLRAALIYPIVLLLFVLLLTTFMMIFVIPAFVDFFKAFAGFHRELPMLGILIFDLSVTYGSLLFGLLLTLLLYMGYSKKRGQEENWSHHLNAALLLHLPGIGKIYHHLEIARSLRTWDFMLTHNAPLDKALEASAQTVHTPVYAKTLRNMGDLIRSGSSFPAVLKQQKLFPKKVVHTLSIGSRAGELPSLLNKLAENYLRKAKLYFEPGIRLMSNFLIILVWLAVGSMVIAMYLQILQVASII